MPIRLERLRTAGEGLMVGGGPDRFGRVRRFGQKVAAATDQGVLLATDRAVVEQLEDRDVGRALATLGVPVGVDFRGSRVAWRASPAKR